MFVNQPVWVNIDLPTKRYVLHKECTYTSRMCETPFKGVGKLKRDGGWIRFRNAEDAMKRLEKEYDHFECLIHCQ